MIDKIHVAFLVGHGVLDYLMDLAHSRESYVVTQVARNCDTVFTAEEKEEAAIVLRRMRLLFATAGGSSLPSIKDIFENQKPSRVQVTCGGCGWAGWIDEPADWLLEPCLRCRVSGYVAPFISADPVEVAI